MSAMKVSATCVLLAFLCIFSSIGYAKLSGSLTVDGEINVQIPYGLFITAVEVSDNPAPSNMDDSKSEVTFLQHSTTVDSTIRMKQGGTATSVTYKVTVLNNTELTYSYRKLYYQTSLTDYSGNDYIAAAANRNKISVVCSLESATTEQKKVAPGGTLEFTVTYTVGRSMSATTNWRTLINYQFGINVDGEREALAVVENKFMDILNTPSTYLQLIDALDNKYDGYQEWTSNYIGNVGNAIDNDMMTVETLFAGQLTMIVNGVPQKAWVLIKHENLDNNALTGDDYTVVYNQYGPITYSGCEMTLYLTVDPLNVANSWAPVYTTVFTCDRDEAGNTISKWYKVGDSYYGVANVVGYNGEYNETGSFVTDNWKSNASTYKVSDDYSYNVEAELSIKTLMQTVDPTTIAEFQRLLIDAEAMIANEKYAGTGIVVVEEAYRKAAQFYTLNEAGKAIANNDTRRVWLIPIMNELDHVLTVAQEAIDKIEQNR